MDALSGSLGIRRGLDWQFEGESGARADAIAVSSQCPAYFPCGQRAAAQAETVAVFAGGEAVIENAGPEFRRNVAPAPERGKNMLWKDFIQSHLEVLAAVDFFTAEVYTIGSHCFPGRSDPCRPMS
jgi:hypothetical protein